VPADEARLLADELRCDVEGLEAAPDPLPPGDRLAPALAVEDRAAAFAPAPACRVPAVPACRLPAPALVVEARDPAPVPEP